MKYAVLALAALLLATLRLASAQEPAAPAKPAEPTSVPAELEERFKAMSEQLQKELPPRELKVKTVPPVMQKLFRADPKLFENKFVAEVFLLVANVDHEDGSSMQAHEQRIDRLGQMVGRFPKDLQRLNHFGNSFLLAPNFGRNLNVPDAFATVSGHFRILGEQTPPELRPQQRIVDYLASAACERDIQLSTSQAGGGFGGNSAVHFLHVRVFAPTEEEARLRTEAIVRLYDAGFSRPMQRYLLAEGEKALAAAREQYPEAIRLSAAMAAEKEKANRPTEISPDILSQLKAQKVMVAVELAGLSARVKACDAMLADPKKLEISTLQSISDMKVKAEIERVGIKEKLDQINIFITEGDQRQTAHHQFTGLANDRIQVRDRIRSSEQTATRYADVFDLYAPFRIEDNQFTVGPVEWTQ